MSYSDEDSLSEFIEYPERKKHKHEKRNSTKSTKSGSRKRKRDPDHLDQDDQDFIPDKQLPGINLDDSLISNLMRYFEENRSPIRKQVKKTLSRMAPSISPRSRSKIAKHMVKHIDNQFISNHAGAKPGDKAWRLTLSRDRVAKLKPILKSIRSEIKQDMLTLPKILEANISFHNKVQAVELFDILQNQEPYTHIWHDTIKEIRTLVKTDKSVTQQTVTAMDEFESHLKAISTDYSNDFKHKIFELDAPDGIKSIIFDKYRNMNLCSDSEKANMRKKLMHMVKLPFNKQHPILDATALEQLPMDERRTQINDFLIRVRQRLDERLYAMDQVKDIIINTIHSRLFSGQSRSILALKGPPGVGKTAIASAIAYAVGLPFDKISAGGMVDPAYFKGSDDVYVGSGPQVTLNILAKHQCNNPVILIDELDKSGDDSSRTMAVQNALFEVMDVDQNSAVKDVYINEFEHDFSHVWWIVSVNDDHNIHAALKSRLDFIEIATYTTADVIQIVNRYIIPEALRKAHLPLDAITVDPSAIHEIITNTKPTHATTQEYIDIRLIKNEIHSIITCLNVCETQRISRMVVSELCSDTTMRDDDTAPRKRQRFTYAVDDFNGFPYCINKKTVQSLRIKSDQSKSKPLMYYS